jgi:hypothetical protein
MIVTTFMTDAASAGSGQLRRHAASAGSGQLRRHKFKPGPLYPAHGTPARVTTRASEAALKGHKMYNPEQPIEILRTIHSFGPCIACAVHVTDPDGEELIKVKAV